MKYDALICCSASDLGLAISIKERLERIVLPYPLRKITGGRKRLSLLCLTDPTDRELLAQSDCLLCICSPAFRLETAWNDVILQFYGEGRRAIPLAYTHNAQEDFPDAFHVIRENQERDTVLGPDLINGDIEKTIPSIAASALNIRLRAYRDSLAMRRRIRLLLGVVAFALLALACTLVVDNRMVKEQQAAAIANHVHTYTAATCTAPSVCSQCDQTDPGSEPLGHDWCVNEDGQTVVCSRCGLPKDSE